MSQQTLSHFRSNAPAYLYTTWTIVGLCPPAAVGDIATVCPRFRRGRRDDNQCEGYVAGVRANNRPNKGGHPPLEPLDTTAASTLGPPRAATPPASSAGDAAAVASSKGTSVAGGTAGTGVGYSMLFVLNHDSAPVCVHEPPLPLPGTGGTDADEDDCVVEEQPLRLDAVDVSATLAHTVGCRSWHRLSALRALMAARLATPGPLADVGLRVSLTRYRRAEDSLGTEGAHTLRRKTTIRRGWRVGVVRCSSKWTQQVCVRIRASASCCAVFLGGPALTVRRARARVGAISMYSSPQRARHAARSTDTTAARQRQERRGRGQVRGRKRTHAGTYSPQHRYWR